MEKNPRRRVKKVVKQPKSKKPQSKPQRSLKERPQGGGMLDSVLGSNTREDEYIEDSSVVGVEDESGFVTEVVDKLRDSARGISGGRIANNVYSFIGLGIGAGATTISLSVALELADMGYKVCVFDADFLNPKIALSLGVPVMPEKTVLNYFNSDSDLVDLLIDVPNTKDNMWMVSTSPVDRPIEMADLQSHLMHDLMDYLKSTFDFVIIRTTYNPFAEWFVYPVADSDWGFIIWDESVNCMIQTKSALDYINSISHKASVMSNVIINKRTPYYSYPYNKIPDYNCELAYEFDFDYSIIDSLNSGKRYPEGYSNDYRETIGHLVATMLSGENV